MATTIDARVHCAVLKIRAVPQRTKPHPRPRRSGPIRVKLAPVPSGPNSVLDQIVTADPLSIPKDVLTDFADKLTK